MEIAQIERHQSGLQLDGNVVHQAGAQEFGGRSIAVLDLDEYRATGGVVQLHIGHIRLDIPTGIEITTNIQ